MVAGGSSTDPIRGSKRSTLWAKITANPLARLILALLFIFPVIQLNNAFSYLVLARLNDPVLTAVQIVKVVGFLWLLMIAYRFYCRRIEQREAAEVSGSGWPREFGGGLALGGGMAVLIVGILAVQGSYGVESLNSPFVLFTRLFRYGQGAFIEELLFTVILFGIIERWGGTVVSYLAVSLLFGLLHLGNDNTSPISAFYIAVTEIAFLAPFILTRRIWMPWAAHLSWNYCQSAVFGLNNSGMEHNGFISPVIDGPDVLTGGAFGIEASVLSVVIHLVIGVPLLIWAWRRGQVMSPSWSRNQGDMA